MCIGRAPFYNENPKKLYDDIQKKDPRFPDPVKDKEYAISDQLTDLIKQLLNKDPHSRLGCEDDSNDILNHEWFEGFDIEQVIQKRYDPSFIPQLSDDIEELSGFNPQCSSMSLEDESEDADLSSVYNRADLFKSFDQ